MSSQLFSSFVPTAGTAGWFLDTAIKSLVVLAAAGGLCIVFRRGSASARHLIWFLAVAALPFVPLLSSLLPSWKKPVWAVSAESTAGNEISLSLELAPTREPAMATRESPVVTDETATAGQSSTVRPVIATHFNAKGLTWVAAIWFGGMTVLLCSITAAHVRRRLLSRRSQRVDDPEWISQLKAAGKEVGLRRKVRLRQTAEKVMPLTWGWWRPVVLLPAEASHWPAERRRVVLLHELAHVKRWDCLTQWITTIVCALFWFNPLVWLGARRMCVERERACDDLVLNARCKASDYANHLVEIARTFRTPRVAAIAMARSSNLGRRVAAIVDISRVRRLRPATALALLTTLAALIACVSGWSASSDRLESSLAQQQIDRLKTFSADKLKQSQTLAAVSGDPISPEFQRLFDAAIAGDWRTVTNLFASFTTRHPQDARKNGSCWSPVLEICLAYDQVVNCDPKYTQIVVDDLINSIPPGSIYFGGSDSGRGLPTAFSKSQIDADPFYTLSQNALVDGSYLNYLQNMYGAQRHRFKSFKSPVEPPPVIYIPTAEELQQVYDDYTADFARREKLNQLKPGESVTRLKDGKLQVASQLGVITMYSRLAKMVFEKNPSREFYVEESFPLDWMYPHLEPHGLIMKLN